MTEKSDYELRSEVEFSNSTPYQPNNNTNAQFYQQGYLNSSPYQQPTQQQQNWQQPYQQPAAYSYETYNPLNVQVHAMTIDNWSQIQNDQTHN